MPNAKPIPDGFERAVAHLVVDGAKQALEFYKNAFGAEVICENPAPDGVRLMHGQFRIGESTFMICDDFPDWGGGKARHPKALGGSPVAIHMYVKDADAAMARAERAGATVTMPAMDTFWGDRYGKLTDPFGHEWSFATRLKDMTPEEIGKSAEEYFANFQGCDKG